MKKAVIDINNGEKAKSGRRKKGSGSLVARDGRWALRWRQDGRITQELTEFRVDVKADRARAEARLEARTEIQRLKRERDQLAVLIARREDVAARLRRLQAEAEPRERAVTLGELEELWRLSPRRRDCGLAILERYAQQLRAFVAWAGPEADLRAVDDAMAERYAAHLAKSLSGNTYNKHLTTLTAIWRAVGKSRGLENPWEDLPRRRLDTCVRRALTDKEVAKIIEVAEGEYKALMIVGARTGLRLGDACRLRWSDFGADGVLRVATRKTDRVVVLPGAQLLAELRKEKGQGDGEQSEITPGIAERYERDPGGVCATIRRIFTRAGIKAQERRSGWSCARPLVSFHSLRHTFVTRAIEAGVAPAIVRALVGHSTAAMTEHYTHIGEVIILEAFDRAQRKATNDYRPRHSASDGRPATGVN